MFAAACRYWGFYKWSEFMDPEDRIYTSKVIGLQHYRGNIIPSNHGNVTQPNKDFKIFKNHRVNDHLITLLVSMMYNVHTSCCLMRNWWSSRHRGHQTSWLPPWQQVQNYIGNFLYLPNKTFIHTSNILWFSSITTASVFMRKVM